MKLPITKKSAYILCSITASTLMPMLLWYGASYPIKPQSLRQKSESKWHHRELPSPSLPSSTPLSSSVNISRSYSYLHTFELKSKNTTEISPSTPSLLPTLLLPTLSPLPVEYPSPIQTDCSSTVHVAIVAPGEIGSRHLYTTIKSIFMHRSTPLHFHFITDNRTMTVLKTMITTWALPAISQDYYDIHKAWTRISSSLNDSQTNCSQALSIQLNLHLILPNSVGHVIVIEPSSVVIIDLAQLWSVILSRSNDVTTVCQSNCVSYCHDGDIELTKWGAVGLNLQKIVQEHSIHSVTCRPNALDIVDNVRFKLSRETCGSVRIYDGEELRYKNMDKCPKRMKPRLQKPPSQRDQCRLFAWERKAHRRELPFLLGHSYNSSGEYDVTLTTHLDYNRLNLLERILGHWDGPASVAIHVTDSQVQGVIDYILNSKSLQHRLNVSYHLLFRVGPSYPPNHARELAHRFVSTPYMFVLDVDYVASFGLYGALKEKLEANLFGSMEKTAVAIPAFETSDKNIKVPHSKLKMVQLFVKHKVHQFNHKYFYQGHGPTDYKKWVTATKPYFASWQNDYEPYCLLKTSVFSFDHRFIARFGDKISHNTELHMAGYKFLVYPDSFVIHLPHKTSKQNMGNLKKCSGEWYKNWITEKRKKYHYTKSDVRNHLRNQV